MHDNTKSVRQSGNSTGPVIGGINSAVNQVELILDRSLFSSLFYAETKHLVEQAGQRPAEGERMHEKIKEILLKQLQLIQEGLEREMSPEEAATLSELLARAVALLSSIPPTQKLRG